MKKRLNYLVVTAVVLIVVWASASVTGLIAGALLNFLLMGGILLLLVWAVRQIR